MKYKMLALSALMSSALIMTSPANADSYSWDVTGTGITGSGTFSTFGSAITSWQGTWAGQTIVGLAPLNPPGYLADNLFTNSAPYFNNNGVVFDAGAPIGIVNIYSSLVGQDYEFSYSDIPAGSDGYPNNPHPDGGFGIPINFSVGAVPEPESYAMMLAGLGLMGFIARRRKQNTSA